MNATSVPPRKTERLSGRHVLGIFLAFFGIIFAVNGYFMYSALKTHTGVVSVEPYRRGLAYNERIAADERQGLLHWQVEFAFGQNGAAHLTLRDATGTAITGQLVTASIGRPSTERFDRTLKLVETAPGQYAASSAPVPSGTWLAQVEVRAADGNEPVYRLRRRLWLTQ